MPKKKQNQRNQMGGAAAAAESDDNHRFNIRTIMKDIEFLGSSHMTWKEKKEMENRKVVSLGGRAPKKQRLPLSVARVVMKKQKEREEKMLNESMILGRFGGNLGGGVARSSADKRRPEDRVLKSSDGHFKNGVLDVKHLFQKAPPKDDDFDGHPVNKGKKKKGSGKKNRGKKKGGGHGRKRR